MSKCPDCTKFTSKDTEQEPEVTDGPDTSFDDDKLTVTATVRIHNDCADCSTELEEASIELEGSVDAKGHGGEGHDLGDVDDDLELERTDSGGGRYAKRLFGVTGTAKVSCECSEEFSVPLKGEDVAASQMESLV